MPVDHTRASHLADAAPKLEDLEVEDEGVASPAIEDARLFDQFRRSSDEGDRDESGIGLGLFIVRSIVERHGGTVRLERTEQGRTRATVELPQEAPA